MTTRPINSSRLRQVLDHISARPESWHQGSWRSASTHCFGGWAVQLSGARWVSGPDGTPAWELLHRDLHVDGPALVEGEPYASVVHVSERAQGLLGLDGVAADRLFNAPTDLDWIRVIVSEILSSGQDAACPWVVRSYRWGPHELYLADGLDGGDVELDRLHRDLYVPFARARRFVSSEHARAYARRYWGSERWEVQQVADECQLGRHDTRQVSLTLATEILAGSDRGVS